MHDLAFVPPDWTVAGYLTEFEGNALVFLDAMYHGPVLVLNTLRGRIYVSLGEQWRFETISQDDAARMPGLAVMGVEFEFGLQNIRLLSGVRAPPGAFVRSADKLSFSGLSGQHSLRSPFEVPLMEGLTSGNEYEKAAFIDWRIVRKHDDLSITLWSVGSDTASS